MARTPAAEVSMVGSSFAASETISAHADVEPAPFRSPSPLTDIRGHGKVARFTIEAVFTSALLLVVLAGCSPGVAEDQTTTSSMGSLTTMSSNVSTSSTSTPENATSTSTTNATQPPPLELEITDPENGLIVKTDEYIFKGTITPGATIRVGSFQAPVEDGTWRIRLSLRRGSNLMTFVAFDDTGRETVRQVQVFYNVDDEGLKPGSP